MTKKVIWLTGLSGSGKSTISQKLVEILGKDNVVVLDGDIVRTGLCSDLGFTNEDRSENIRRIAELSKILLSLDKIIIVALISPFIKDRKIAKDIIGPENFIELFLDCPIDVCEKRDVKGLYKKARAGEIELFTGITSAYEKPTSPDITLPTNNLSLNECSNILRNYFL